MKKIFNLKTVDDWKELKHYNGEIEKLLLFKVSPICGVSFSAEKKVEQWFSKVPEEERIYLVKVDVVNAKELSRYIAEETGVKHQSPQMIAMDNELNVIDHTSHHRINEKFLNSIL
jgi:bacillithiol system protein YtxJ